MFTSIAEDQDLQWNSMLQYSSESMGSIDPKTAFVDPFDFMHVDDFEPQGNDEACIGTFQRLTPPPSTPDVQLSVSQTFHSDFTHDMGPTDVVILSCDCLWFFVHTEKLLEASQNNFNGLLPCDSNSTYGSFIAVPESSAVLNIVLHKIYEISFEEYRASFAELADAITSLETYGFPLVPRTTLTGPLFTLFASLAPDAPLETYTLAASHGLYNLAVMASAYCHSISLSSLTDDMAEQMGSTYVKRLFFLHFGRAEALKRILVTPPHPHAQIGKCSSANQRKLENAWSLASASLVWNARADISSDAIEAALSPLARDIDCDICQGSLQNRIKILIAQWAEIKQTI